jgi:hypothetical protein
MILKSEIDFSHKSMPKMYLPNQILSISCRDFNDKISFYGINKSFQLIKYRRDLIQKSSHNHWMFRNILISKSDIIIDMTMHNDYPILVTRTITNELWFYIEEQVCLAYHYKLIICYSQRKRSESTLTSNISDSTTIKNRLKKCILFLKSLALCC